MLHCDANKADELVEEAVILLSKNPLKQKGVKKHGSVFVLLLGLAYCSLSLQFTALAADCNWSITDQAILRQIDRYLHDSVSGGNQSDLGNLITGNRVDLIASQMSIRDLLRALGRGIGVMNSSYEKSFSDVSTITLMQAFQGWTGKSPAILPNGVLGMLEDIANALDSVESSNSNVETQLSDMAATVENISSYVDGVESSLGYIESGIDDLNTSVQNVNNSVQNVNYTLANGIVALQNTIDSSSSDIQTSIQGVTTAIGNVRSDTSAIRTDVHTIASNASSTSETLTEISENVESVGESTDNLGQMLEDVIQGESRPSSADGQGTILNKISSNSLYGNSGLSMLDLLQIIGRSVGGLNTQYQNGFEDNQVISLAQAILGWTGAKNPQLYDNGILGKLDRIYDADTNIVDAVDYQTSIISQGFARVTQQLDNSIINQTNLMYLASSPYYDFTYQKFVEYLNDSFLEYYDVGTFASSSYVGTMLNIPDLAAVYSLGSAYRNWIDNAYYAITDDNFPPDSASLGKLYYKYYGNLHQYSDILGDDDGYQVKSDADSITNEFQAAAKESDDDFEWKSAIYDKLDAKWGPIEDALADLETTVSPDQNIESLSQLVSSALTEESETGGFAFSIQFDQLGSPVEFETDTLFTDSATLALVKRHIDVFINFVVMIMKGGLILLLGWRSASTAMNVLNDHASI